MENSDFQRGIYYYYKIVNAQEISNIDDIREELSRSHNSQFWLLRLCDYRRSLIQEEKQRKIKEENESRKIYNNSKLTRGNYYLVYMNDKQLEITIGNEDTCKPIAKRIPVVVHCDENFVLRDIISGTVVSLNILDSVNALHQRVFVDYVVEMNNEEMKNALAIFNSMKVDDKEKYKSSLITNYGINYKNYERLLGINNGK